MSLFDELNDLLPTGSETFEDLEIRSSQVTFKEKNGIQNTKFEIDPVFVNKFNNLYSLISVKKIVSETEVLSKDIAIEEIAGFVNNLETLRAKLTRYPSSHNKDVMTNALKNTDDSLPDEAKLVMSSFLSTYEDIREQLVISIDSHASILKLIKVEYDRLSKNHPRIYTEGIMMDLLTHDLNELSYMSFSDCKYQNYIDGLSSVLRDLIKSYGYETYLGVIGLDKSLSEGISTEVLEETSEHDVAEDLLEELGEEEEDITKEELNEKTEVAVPSLSSGKEVSISSIVNHAFMYLNSASDTIPSLDSLNGRIVDYTSKEDQKVDIESRSIINSIQSGYDTIYLTQKLGDIVSTPNNVLDSLLKLLRFLE